jgi:alpha/beta superfamily hydrolase
MLDVAAAVEGLAPFADDVPLVVIGYSFGADVSLTCTHPRIDAWCAVAPPLRVVAPGLFVAGVDHRPKRLLVPEHDQFDPPAEAAARVRGWQNTSLRTIAMADHFLAGRAAAVVEECIAFLADLEG